MASGTKATGASSRHGARAIKEGKILRVLQLAMAQGKPVAALYRGQPLTMSPHILGRRGDDLYVLIFGILGSGDGAVPLRWQWIRAEELQDVRLQDGFWLTAPGERPSADFLDRIIAEATVLPSRLDHELPTL